MKKTTFMLFIAGMMVLALFVPAAMAANYPQNGQFIAQYDEDKLITDTASENGGTTYYAGDATKAASSLVSVTTTTTDPGDDWPQFHRYIENQGNSPCDGLPSDNSSVYIFGDRLVIGAINPVIENGKILVLTGYAGFDEPGALTEINLTCIDESTMSVLWDFPLPRNVHYGSWSSPATDGTYAYAASDDKLYCVNLANGQEVWNFTTIKSTSCNGGPTIGGDYVFCSDWEYSNCNYYCLDKDDGDLNWIFNSTCTNNPSGYFQSTPAYEAVDGNEYVYFAGWGYNNVYSQIGVLYKVNVATGVEEWNAEEADMGAFCGSPTISGSYVYVTSYDFSTDGYLFKFRKSSGRLSDSVQIERTDATPAIDEENGLIYVSGGCSGYASPGVRCFYISNFTEKWSRVNEDMGGWTSSVSLADGYAFVGREASYPYCYDTIYALDAETGATEWFYPQGGATAAIANDKVYSVGNDGNLYRFG